MANLTEANNFDTGVYQIETTDPVLGGPGGIDNLPHQALANRTNYLKAHVDAIEAALGGYAPLNSPAFTGSPTCPTQPLGDRSTKLANTMFVQDTIGAVLFKSVAGGSNIALSINECGYGIIVFQGVITANISVLVQLSPTKSWVFRNETTGNFTLTVKTAAGTGVVLSQGKTNILHCDGTNVVASHTDFLNAALLGVPTCPTASTGTSNTQIASTAFVHNVASSLSGSQATETVIGIAEIATQAETNAGTDDMRIVTPKKLLSGISKSLDPSNGYLKFPAFMGGFIIQWGRESDGVNTSGRIYFNIPFPTANFIRLVYNDNPSSTDASGVNNLNITAFQEYNTTYFDWVCKYADSGIQAVPDRFAWLAIGY